jgi:hypothetical protein
VAPCAQASPRILLAAVLFPHSPSLAHVPTPATTAHAPSLGPEPGCRGKARQSVNPVDHSQLFDLPPSRRSPGVDFHFRLGLGPQKQVFPVALSGGTFVRRSNSLVMNIHSETALCSDLGNRTFLLPHERNAMR